MLRIPSALVRAASWVVMTKKAVIATMPSVFVALADAVGDQIL